MQAQIGHTTYTIEDETGVPPRVKLSRFNPPRGSMTAEQVDKLITVLGRIADAAEKLVENTRQAPECAAHTLFDEVKDIGDQLRSIDAGLDRLVDVTGQVR